MPRIEAETVAEHRHLREASILAAARSLLLETGPKAVTPGAVANKVGLGRTAIYKYFACSEDLLERIIDDSFAAWLATVTSAVDQAPDTASKIDAYVTTSLSLGTGGAHHVAELASAALTSDRARLASRHRELSAPLTAVLEQSSLQHPAIVADLIDGMIGRAIRKVDQGMPSKLIADTTLGVIRRALDTNQSNNAARGQP